MHTGQSAIHGKDNTFQLCRQPAQTGGQLVSKLIVSVRKLYFSFWPVEETCTQMHTHTHTPFLPLTPPRWVHAQPTQVSTHSVGVYVWIKQPRQNRTAWFTSARRHSPLTASESSNPWRYKLSYMEEWGSQKWALQCKIVQNGSRSTCSGEDGWWGKGSDREHQQSLPPHEGRWKRTQITEEQIYKKKRKKAGVQSSPNAELDVTAPRSNKCCFPL